ncbi:MAG: neutral zinc metallopeptidase [Bauldia sp.]
MKWRGRRQSGNVIDRRGTGGAGGGLRLPTGGMFGGGTGSGRLPGGLGGGLGGGIGILAIIVVGAFLLFNSGILGDGGTTTTPTQETGTTGLTADEAGQFVATILADTEDVWTQIFQAGGETYPLPQLVLFNGSTNSGCGFADAATGPFYCPADQRLYIDLAFYDELRSRFEAPGDFAQAYVIAHEVGHHVQNVLGDLSRQNGARSQAAANDISIRIELQADCYAGIWANRTAALGYLEAGDFEEAMNAAAQIGDDAIQRREQGYVQPETFNHGTSAQRQRWFQIGYQQGSVAACNTFDATTL